MLVAFLPVIFSLLFMAVWYFVGAFLDMKGAEDAAVIAKRQQKQIQAEFERVRDLYSPKPAIEDWVDRVTRACPSAWFLRPDWSGPSNNLKDPSCEPFWMKPPVPLERKVDRIDVASASHYAEQHLMALHQFQQAQIRAMAGIG